MLPVNAVMAPARRSCGVDEAASWRRRSCSTSIFLRRAELRCSGRGGGKVGSFAIDLGPDRPSILASTERVGAHTGSKHQSPRRTHSVLHRCPRAEVILVGNVRTGSPPQAAGPGIKI